MARYRRKKPTAWIWIIFWFAVFPPVGIYLLIKRLQMSSAKTFANDKTLIETFDDGNTLRNVVILCALVGLVGMSFDLSNFYAAIILSGGIFCIIQMLYRRRQKREYRRYLVLIERAGMTSLAEIADTLGVAYEDALHTLEKMIELGHLGDAFIDYGQREIVLIRGEGRPARPQPAAQQRVTCPRCGAQNTVQEGKPRICEYCDSDIDYTV
jgi:hypothetical protein